MLARIRKAQEEREGGFTLIELLVVIIIIGILAAIAIPVFLNQRKKAVDASIKSDLRTVANEEETYFVDNQAYLKKASVAAGALTTITITPANPISLSSGNVLNVKLNAAGTAYCIEGFNLKATFNAATANLVYISDAGGLQATTVTACPGTYT